MNLDEAMALCEEIEAYLGPERAQVTVGSYRWKTRDGTVENPYDGSTVEQPARYYVNFLPRGSQGTDTFDSREEWEAYKADLKKIQAMTLKEYTVTWTVEVEAFTPEGAAQEALEIQRDPESIATVFEVQEIDGVGSIHRVDLTYSETDVV